jgi:hypothetical protein
MTGVITGTLFVIQEGGIAQAIILLRITMVVIRSKPGHPMMVQDIHPIGLEVAFNPPMRISRWDSTILE